MKFVLWAQQDSICMELLLKNKTRQDSFSIYLNASKIHTALVIQSRKNKEIRTLINTN